MEKKKKGPCQHVKFYSILFFCLSEFTFNVKTSSTESAYLHNLHGASHTQKKKRTMQISFVKTWQKLSRYPFIATKTTQML